MSAFDRMTKNEKDTKKSDGFLVSFLRSNADSARKFIHQKLKKGGGYMAKENLLSKVYNAEEIQQLLGIGRSKTYDFLDEVNKKQAPFRVIKIGRIYRVPKESFDRWIDGEEA